MKPSLWDLKLVKDGKLEREFTIMKPSLWDLKRSFVFVMIAEEVNHETIPMGFETLARAKQTWHRV